MITAPLPFVVLHLLDCLDLATHAPLAVKKCEEILPQARDAIRAKRLDEAEAILRAGGDGIWQHAACLNVLGVLAEARGDWEAARRLWSRCARRDRKYEPPRQNLRRYFELFHWGRCRDYVAFGDEPKFLKQKMEMQS